jgi:hypothetical protein
MGDSVTRWFFIDVIVELTNLVPEVGPGRPSIDVNGINFSYVRVTGIDRTELETELKVFFRSIFKWE